MPFCPERFLLIWRHQHLISKKSNPSKYAQFYPHFSVLVNRRIIQKLFNSIRLPNSTFPHPFGKKFAFLRGQSPEPDMVQGRGLIIFSLSLSPACR
jgi:hypothetical protein